MLATFLVIILAVIFKVIISPLVLLSAGFMVLFSAIAGWSAAFAPTMGIIAVFLDLSTLFSCITLLLVLESIIGIYKLIHIFILRK